MKNVPSKYPDKPPVKKPEAILNCEKCMVGVDRSDHVISNYQFMRQTKIWYQKLSFWILEVSIIDAYVLYKTLQNEYETPAMSNKNFTRE